MNNNITIYQTGSLKAYRLSLFLAYTGIAEYNSGLIPVLLSTCTILLGISLYFSLFTAMSSCVIGCFSLSLIESANASLTGGEVGTSSSRQGVPLRSSDSSSSGSVTVSLCLAAVATACCIRLCNWSVVSVTTPEACVGATVGGAVSGASSSNEVLYKESVRINHTAAYPYNNMLNGHSSNLGIKDSRFIKSTGCCPITSRNFLINQTIVKKTLDHTRINPC